jgi:hypothetical protein
MKKIVAILVWISVLPLIIGCAVVPHKPVPITKDKVLVKISGQGASNWTDVPVAGYKIPQSHIVVILKKTSSASESGVFLSLLPMLAIQLSGSEEGKQGISDAEYALQFDLADEINRILLERLKQDCLPPNWVVSNGDGVHLMEITPYIIMYIDDSQHGRVYLTFKSRLLERGRREIWWTRYTYFIPEVRPLIGKDSWTENNGEPLRTAIHTALHKVFDVMFRDARGEGEWKKAPGKLKMKYAWYVFSFKGEYLDETDDLVVFNIPAQATYLYGINIIPRSEIVEQSH